MTKTKKPTQSEIDGVQYRRAKLWQIILTSCNALCGMGVYILIGQVSYAASIGFGITTAIVGVILTGTRILDAVTDPLLAFLYDRVNTKFGKIRILLITGFLIEAFALWGMYSGFASKGLGVVAFVILYIVYVIGYTINNMTAQTIGPLLTNDPKQRPTLGVWGTAFNYLVPMIFTIILNMVVLKAAGGEYNQAYLTMAVWVTLGIGLLGTVLTCIGVSPYDKPELLNGVSAKKENLKIRDMIDVLAHNKPLQQYIAAASSDKIAQVTGSQAIITTLLYGIMIGDMGLATMLSVIAMLPSIVFAIFGAKYTGKHGSRKAIFNWTIVCIIVAAVTAVYFLVIDPASISHMGVTMILYVLLTFALNGAKMCVTTANTSYMADTIDFELDRSGKYVPAVVTGTASLLDKIISAFGAMIATGAVALIGYTTTMPQPGDPMTGGVVAVTLAVMYGLPIIGWIITLIAMKNCKLTKEEMVQVQKRIAEKKAALSQEEAE